MSRAVSVQPNIPRAAALALLVAAAPLAACHWAKPPPYIDEEHACAGVATGAIAGSPTLYQNAGQRWDAATQTFTTTMSFFKDAGDATPPLATLPVACTWRPGTLDETQHPIADPQLVEIGGHRLLPGDLYDPQARRWKTAAPKR